MFKRSAIAVLLLLLPSAPKVANAFAAPCINKGLEKQVIQLTQTVAWVEAPGELGRQTEEEYTPKGKDFADTQNRFAATGVLKCGGYTGSAQLTGNGDTITTSAHMFTSEKCVPLRSEGGCEFTVKNAEGEQTVEVGNLIESGFKKCPRIPGIQDDWAVLKLKKPMVGVRHYRIPKIWDHVEKDDKLISVSGTAKDFHRDSNGKRTFPKALEDCKSGMVYRAGWFESTCDVGPGASGGSVLKATPKGDVLVAIHASNHATKDEREKEMKGLAVKKPYKENEWASQQVPVSGRFLEVLEETIGSQ